MDRGIPGVIFILGASWALAGMAESAIKDSAENATAIVFMTASFCFPVAQIAPKKPERKVCWRLNDWRFFVLIDVKMEIPDVRFGSLADKPPQAKIHLCPLLLQ